MNPADIWNERYSKRAYAYGKSPNQFIADELAKLDPAGLLLPGEGEGRNAVHAMENGWNVIAFDQSEQARSKAIALGEERGIYMEYAVADAREFLCPVLVDVLAYCYFHVPGNLQHEIYGRMNRFLNKSGALIFEGFSEKNIGMGSGGPQTPSMCFTEERVRRLFSDFSRVEVWEEKIELHEGLYHDGEAWVIRARGVK